nr:uncharacterized protein LOC107034882 [Vicugna pacos]
MNLEVTAVIVALAPGGLLKGSACGVPGEFVPELELARGHFALNTLPLSVGAWPLRAEGLESETNLLHSRDSVPTGQHPDRPASQAGHKGPGDRERPPALILNFSPTQGEASSLSREYAVAMAGPQAAATVQAAALPGRAARSRGSHGALSTFLLTSLWFPLGHGTSPPQEDRAPSPVLISLCCCAFETLLKSVSSHISSTPGAARAEPGLCPPGSPSSGGANTAGCLDAVRSATRLVRLHPLRRWTVREVVGAEPCRLSRGALKTCLLRHLCRRSVRSRPLTLSGAESPAPAAGGARQAQVSSLQEEAPSAQKTPRLAIFQALTCCQGHRSNAGSTWHQQASGPLDEGQGRPACHDLCYQLLAYI